jgi:hypothetical protein
MLDNAEITPAPVTHPTATMLPRTSQRHLQLRSRSHASKPPVQTPGLLPGHWNVAPSPNEQRESDCSDAAQNAWPVDNVTHAWSQDSLSTATPWSQVRSIDPSQSVRSTSSASCSRQRESRSGVEEEVQMQWASNPSYALHTAPNSAQSSRWMTNPWSHRSTTVPSQKPGWPAQRGSGVSERAQKVCLSGCTHASGHVNSGSHRRLLTQPGVSQLLSKQLIAVRPEQRRSPGSHSSTAQPAANRSSTKSAIASPAVGGVGQSGAR